MTKTVIVRPKRTLYLRDVKIANTDGGGFTIGSWHTRDLNNVLGDTSFVTLPSSFTDSNFDNNGATPDETEQYFTLVSGKYEIIASAPTYRIQNHILKLRNITDGSDVITGNAATPDTAEAVGTTAIFRGIFTIAAAKQFAIQHQGSRTQATTGLGRAANLGVSEVYTQVQITKIDT